MKKRISSLLFYSFRSRANSQSYFDAYMTLAAQWGRDDLPEIEIIDLGPDEAKCMLDMSNWLDHDIEYDSSIARLIQQYETVFRELLAVDESIICYLSAQITIDQDIKVFNLKSPRFPSSISAFENFVFEYSVWHLTR